MIVDIHTVLGILLFIVHQWLILSPLIFHSLLSLIKPIPMDSHDLCWADINMAVIKGSRWAIKSQHGPHTGRIYRIRGKF